VINLGLEINLIFVLWEYKCSPSTHASTMVSTTPLFPCESFSQKRNCQWQNKSEHIPFSRLERNLKAAVI
jgi:hypothetical protein